jgi:hypothetical protein
VPNRNEEAPSFQIWDPGIAPGGGVGAVTEAGAVGSAGAADVRAVDEGLDGHASHPAAITKSNAVIVRPSGNQRRANVATRSMLPAYPRCLYSTPPKVDAMGKGRRFQHAVNT